jgi:hypothetical protein
MYNPPEGLSSPKKLKKYVQEDPYLTELLNPQNQISRDQSGLYRTFVDPFWSQANNPAL